MFPTPRRLVPFRPQDLPHRFADVLVLGTGLAGLRAALAIDPGRRVALFTKGKDTQSNSAWAQGGIAAVWDPEDTFQAHVGDTLEAGKGLCDEGVVELVVREAPQRVRELIGWGADFDHEGGALALGQEGGHTRRRIVHAFGDATGQEVVRAALKQVRARPNVVLREGRFLVDLLLEDGVCRGALAWHADTGLEALWADQTILATGGCGQLFRETTNPPVATGDGMAAAWRAGAALRDMEFMQFHPTVLYVAGAARSLVSEAVRGEGAYLRDAAGERFMPAYDPRAELAPRDVVSQAIFAQMGKTRAACVYLDCSHLDAAAVRQRFPGIAAACAKFGLDIARDRIPVRPGAHYMVGGVATDRAGRTTVPGLWACGEVAATGLHGANRLASNSLLEALVFGARCGEGANAELRGAACRVPPIAHADADNPPPPDLDVADLRNALQSEMFRHVGIERDAAGLAQAEAAVAFWSRYALPRTFGGPPGWELQNLLTVAGLMIRAARARTESRGTHRRADFPAADQARWHVHMAMAIDRPEPWSEPA